jgi:hypothetical protein
MESIHESLGRSISCVSDDRVLQHAYDRRLVRLRVIRLHPYRSGHTLTASPATSVKTAASMEVAPSMKATMKAAVEATVEAAMRSEVAMMEVMKTINEEERRAEAERHRRPIKPRIVIGIVCIQGRRINVAHLSVRALLLDLPGAVGLLACKA